MDTLETKPVYYFPIRHHSPACSAHLSRALDMYKPDIILIEGPEDTNDLLEHISSPKNTAPMAIYYAYSEKSGEKAASYFPLLDFSPELVAIRYAYEKGLPARFIDMPYSLLLPYEKSLDEGKKQAYYDDYLLFHSRFTELLCEKQGVRGHSELWEKLFELNGIYMGTQAFVDSVLAWCDYSREGYTEQMLKAEGCLAREEWMAENIRSSIGLGYERIFALTGGFHSNALRLMVENPPKKQPKKPKAKGESSAWLIPFSLAESDQLAGYASGMPYPAFYQAAYEAAQSGSGMPYRQAVLSYAAKIGSRLRKNKHSVTLADEAAAFAQAIGLAELRGKSQPGAYEMLDAALSSYIKSSKDAASFLAMQSAGMEMRGDKTGSIGSGATIVPLLSDFQQKAAEHRLKASSVSNEIALDILSSASHRRASAFLHQLSFLETGFASMLKGPNYAARDSSRVRETWRYAFSAKVSASIISSSYLGGTVEEAALTLLKKKSLQTESCEALSSLAIHGAVMALPNSLPSILELASSAIAEDSSFASLVAAAQNFSFMDSAKDLLRLPDSFSGSEAAGSLINKAVSLIEALTASSEKEDLDLAGALKSLYSLLAAAERDKEPFTEALIYSSKAPSTPPSIHGAIAGLLYALGEIDSDGALAMAESYLYGAGEEMKKSGRFLAGLFMAAGDILFEPKSGFIKGMDNVLGELSEAAFLSVLPELRIALSNFAPSQIDRAAGIVASLYSIDAESLLEMPVADSALALGMALDAYAKEKLWKTDKN